MTAPLPGPAPLPARTLAALGVVFGDIGTSPIYTLRESFTHLGSGYGVEPHVLGILSLVFWSLVVVVTLKYVVLIMQADNRGEGGIMALTALALGRRDGARSRRVIALLGLGGTALFYGDAVITPAISVLSAVEGLEIATPALKPLVLPLSIAILTLLFMVQRRGTAVVGTLFGPVILLWFFAIGALGLSGLAAAPQALAALSPHYGLALFVHEPLSAFLVLGSVVLAFTGAEALYADMGHFGRTPIRLAWSVLVLPALALSYFGQGALILSDPAMASHPFYLLAPGWALYPLVGLTTAATVIASQATISGAFSITRQAIQLGYLPRLHIRHTSETETGQIYIARVNWGMWLAVAWLCITFHSSGALASAYGIAVTGTMVMTTALAWFVMRDSWGFGLVAATVVIGAFLTVDFAFFAANLVKIADGGWFPVAVAAGLVAVMLTWQRGRTLLLARLGDDALSEEQFLARVTENRPDRVPGTAVFLTASASGIPHALLHNLKHNKVLHARVILLTVANEEVPYIRADERLAVTPLQKGFFRVLVRYGFMETPDLPVALTELRRHGIALDAMETSFFLGRDTIVPASRSRLATWQRRLFVWLARSGASAPDFFRLPPNRVVELGTQVEV